uniref:Uncharacterized protein n=1 Tax=Rhizophora mucronata TaxID=61149 RepID=A0A2P2NYF3_RHIMU
MAHVFLEEKCFNRIIMYHRASLNQDLEKGVLQVSEDDLFVRDVFPRLRLLCWFWDG